MVSNPNYVLGVDLDNVTAKYTDALRDFMIKKGHDANSMPEPAHYSFVDSGWPFTDIEDYLNHHHEFVAKGGFLSVDPMENASEVLHSLIKEGVRIRIITHRILRDGNHYDSISYTAKWLDLHNIPYHDFCVISEKSAVGVNLLIDDAPSNIESVRAHGGYVAVYDQLYNRHLDGPRVRDWNDIYTFVLNHKAVLEGRDNEQITTGITSPSGGQYAVNVN